MRSKGANSSAKRTASLTRPLETTTRNRPSSSTVRTPHDQPKSGRAPRPRAARGAHAGSPRVHGIRPTPRRHAPGPSVSAHRRGPRGVPVSSLGWTPRRGPRGAPAPRGLRAGWWPVARRCPAGRRAATMCARAAEACCPPSMARRTSACGSLRSTPNGTPRRASWAVSRWLCSRRRGSRRGPGPRPRSGDAPRAPAGQARWRRVRPASCRGRRAGGRSRRR